MEEDWKYYPDIAFAETDAEHRAISKQMAKLLDAINAGHDVEIGLLMASLVADVTTHFKHEERLMRDHAYPKAVEHTEAHASFLRDAVAYKAEFDTHGPTPKFRRWATGRLLKWFRFHILAHDVELGIFLRALDGVAPGTAAAHA